MLGDIASKWQVNAQSKIAFPASIVPSSVKVYATSTSIQVTTFQKALTESATINVIDSFSLGDTSIRWTSTYLSSASNEFAIRPQTVFDLGSSQPFNEYWLAANTPGVSALSDPLAFGDLQSEAREFVYGGSIMAWANARINGLSNSSRPPDAGTYSADGNVDGFSVPLVVLRENIAGVGLGIMCELTDMTTFMNISFNRRSTSHDDKDTADSQGHYTTVIIFERDFVRVGGRSDALFFAMDILTGSSDWRPFLHWAAEAYPKFFQRSEKVDYDSIDGAVAYADYRGAGLNVSYLKAVNFQLNWDASFPFTYHGDYSPAMAPDGSTADWFWACFA
jgi:hypothetical protein